MTADTYLGIDCGSVSLNLVVLHGLSSEPLTLYRRTRGRPLQTLIEAVDELVESHGNDIPVTSALVTGSGRELLSRELEIPAVNEISAHAAGVHRVDPRVRTIIEIGGQDSKFIRTEPSPDGGAPRFPVFRMNEICAAGTGAFLDEQAGRLGIPVEQFGSIALQSRAPAPIAGRCAVFAKTDMIHKAQEGIPLPDILLGLAFALARNYIATLIKGDSIAPIVSLQGGVMSNQAVVHAFKTLLDLDDDEIVTPPYFTVLGALGCATLASRDRSGQPFTLRALRDRAVRSLQKPPPRSFLPPLDQDGRMETSDVETCPNAAALEPPLVMGLDVGSVSVKGVVVDSTGRMVREDYRLSRSRPLETMKEVVKSLSSGCAAPPALIAVTGSGRYLAGRLIDADLIVNEITAQARAALKYDSAVDTVVEIGGQDSKWISLEAGKLKDFEMNRVCAAGTGSFLMEQADRLGFSMGTEFSDAAFSSRTPADLGNRCTVFMESDLIHHQNNGATSGDLAAGVCVSIVHNYLERVANNKPMGNRVLFLGGVAATPAVRAAFEGETRRHFDSPAYYRVSGALGAALKALDGFEAGEMLPRERGRIDFDPAVIRREQFRCKGCPNRCLVDKYYPENRIVFHGGLCDRWEEEQRSSRGSGRDLFDLRTSLLEEISGSHTEGNRSWGMARSPQFFEWFPFWKAFLEKLGIDLVAAPRSNRRQFERGSRYLKVETCLPVKIMAGQIADLVDSGIGTLFHPSLLTERSSAHGSALLDHCPYIQASSQFFKGSFDVEWKEPLISHDLDPDSFLKEHAQLARALGASRREAHRAIEYGMECQKEFEAKLRQAGRDFLNSLAEEEQGFVVLGKPYHTADSFLNMNLGSLVHRLGVRALPADLYPFDPAVTPSQVSWKYQSAMIRVAREIAEIPQLFPVLITFFGCGPDPFTVRHIREALAGKPLLILEMDEHTSRAGVITRMEAFLERLRMERKKPAPAPKNVRTDQGAAGAELESKRTARSPRAEVLYLPYMADHAYGFAAAARSLGVDARVLTPPDRESEQRGRPHMVGGECHPYALILGDYLKMAETERPETGERSLFYVIGFDACRLGQYPTYIEKVRRELGYSIRVISEIDEGLASFGLSESNQRRVLLRAWEGLNAYDLLSRLFLQIRPVASDRTVLERVYGESRDKLFQALSEGRVRQGMEEALHGLYRVPVDERPPQPEVVVTGDYYTRVVSFANNAVYEEIESLGGVLRAPPTFSDAFKIGPLRDLVGHLVARRMGKAVEDAILFLYMAVSEFRVKGGRHARRVQNESLDLLGRRMWKSADRHAHTRLPAGITAPIVTALRDVDTGGDGILNLITLNCAYGTVVTAALSRALKERPGVPMLTLIFDGLQKTNEKTRLEAFMEQVRDNFERRTGFSIQ